MKKIVLLMLAVVAVMNAGFLTSAQSFTDKEIKTHKKSLDTYGLNPRVYVFTVGAEEGAKQPMQCIIVYTEQNLGESKKGGKSTAPQLECIKLK